MRKRKEIDKLSTTRKMLVSVISTFTTKLKLILYKMVENLFSISKETLLARPNLYSNWFAIIFTD